MDPFSQEYEPGMRIDPDKSLYITGAQLYNDPETRQLYPELLSIIKQQHLAECRLWVHTLQLPSKKGLQALSGPQKHLTKYFFDKNTHPLPAFTKETHAVVCHMHVLKDCEEIHIYRHGNS